MTRRQIPLFLALRDVTLRADCGLAFQRTHWEWRRGQHWALLGPNGSGKSLLARAIAGHVPVAHGAIEFGFAAPPGRAHEDAIALVSSEQSHELGLDSVPGARWFAMEHDEAPRVADILSRACVEEINPFDVDPPSRRPPAAFSREQRAIVRLLGIAELWDRDLLALSNGERRKVLIARALLKRPRLLILDDPFAGLDAGSRHHFRHVLSALIRDNRVHVLLITMRADELPRRITHVLQVAGCRIASSGPVPARAKPACEVGAGPSSLRSRSSCYGGVDSAPSPSTAAHVRDAAEIVRLRNVTVRYGRQVILRNLSWAVRCGESWAILGPNGSGKTTLLSLLSGDNPQAYANDVSVFGQQRGDGDSVWDLRRRVAVISPDVLLNSGAARRPGEQQLELLARALARHPDLLILDEPCQGLDERHRRQFVRAVESAMKRRALTVLYVTHHADEIPRGIRRVLHLRAGRALTGRL